MDYLYGIANLNFWGYVLATVIMVQITIMGVTVYLHRDAAHRSVDLHPAIRHFFRLWIWMTSGMMTREWVAIHRKHHAKCETPDDPHSPQVEGLKKVLLEGAELYRAETENPETMEKYGRGTPDDWIERNVYKRWPFGGIVLLVVLNLLFFGVPGIIIIAVQMMSMPLFAAGIINGIGHHSGYRNFECDDASTNIVPFGILLGGEELHNNHHAFPSSAKFSIRPWEFDIGWLYIQVFRFLGLAKVKKVAPRPKVKTKPAAVDLETVRAVIVNRMHVLRDYTRKVTLPTFDTERAALRARGSRALDRARKLFVRRPTLLDDAANAKLKELLAHNQALATVHEFRERLRAIWDGAHVSNERLLTQFKEWCAQAEASGIRSLQDFAEKLKAYSMQPVPVRA